MGDVSSLDLTLAGSFLNRRDDKLDSQARTANIFDDIPVPSSVDIQLFPGGPAAATHTRTQQCLHALLQDITLPAINDIHANMRPHGTRNGYTSKKSGIETSSNLRSSSGVNILRLNGCIDGTNIYTT